MKASEIFRKTSKGQSEVGARSDALSVKERRVLILVNGENNAAKLRDLSLCDNIVEILEILLTGGFIEPQNAAAVASSSPATFEEEPADEKQDIHDVGAREFMCNTLLTFANRVRVSKLIEDINSVEDVEALKALVKPWYMAISETPGGMYQADDLRKEVNGMIDAEEVTGLR